MNISLFPFHIRTIIKSFLHPKHDHFILRLVCINFKNQIKSPTNTSIKSFITSVTHFQWARAHGLDNNSWVCANIAMYGCLDTLKWAIASEYKYDYRVCKNAIQYGNLNVLEWALKNNCNYDSFSSIIAAKNGRLDILKCLHNNKAVILFCMVCLTASKYGHLNILKWVREIGYTWDYKIKNIILNDACLLKNKHIHKEFS
jgi:hypothetical protein